MVLPDAYTLAVVSALSVVGGIALTCFWVRKKERMLVLTRLVRWLPNPASVSAPMVLIKACDVRPLERMLSLLPMWERLGVLLGQCGFGGYLLECLCLLVILLVFPLALAFALGLNLAIAALCGFVLALLSVVSLVVVASRRAIRFSEQMPDAIDLMVSVLR